MKKFKAELDEGKFRDYLNAGLLGAGLALAPMSNAAEIPIEQVPKTIVKQYNLKHNISVADAQAMADLAITNLGDVAISEDPTSSAEWDAVQRTYVQLAHLDYKVATAFLGKFNVASKKLFGVQIRPIAAPKVSESVVNEALWDDNARGTSDFEEWKAKVVDLINDGMIDLTVMSDRDIVECEKLLKYYFKQRSLPPIGAARWITRDLKKFMMTGKSKFMTPEEIEFKRKIDAALAAHAAKDSANTTDDPSWRGPNGTWTLD